MVTAIVNRKRLKECIEKKKLTYGDVGCALGVCTSTVSRKVSGERQFTEEEMYQLVKLFGRGILNLPIK